MQKITVKGMECQFEKLDAENFKHGAAAFRVIDKDGEESFWVNYPMVKDSVATPNDGRTMAICPTKEDALSVAAALNIATVAAYAQKADALDIDLDKLQNEVNRLKAKGKTAEQVIEIFGPKVSEFEKKGGSPERKRGEW